MADLTTHVGPLPLKNPVLTASGTFGYGDDLPDYVHIDDFGGIVTKSLTGQPREGNAPPRIVETSSGMINSIGLANIGVDAFITEKLPIVRNRGMALIVNIAGSTMDEYATVLDRLEEAAGIDGYEINVSCPNVKEGGMEFGVSATHLYTLIYRLKQQTQRPIITKLSPNVTSIQEMAVAAAEAGSDILSLINTLVGSQIDIETRRPVLSTTFGGLSGPAIKPVAIAQVYKVYKAVEIPIIGIGGIQSASDIIEYLMAGASAVEIGTMNYRDPGLGPKLVPEISHWMDEHGYATVSELIGVAHD